MKIHAFVLAFGGLVGAATVAQAQTAKMPPDPLADLQNTAGAIVGATFRVPDPIVHDLSQPGSPALAGGKALRTSLEVPGAIFAGVLKPFADADADPVTPPAPVAAPAPQRRRHARVHHHRASSQS